MPDGKVGRTIADNSQFLNRAEAGEEDVDVGLGGHFARERVDGRQVANVDVAAEP